MVVQSPKNDNSSSLKTIYLEGKSPWGFRIIDLNESNRSILHSSTLAISKVRNKSKAHIAGLKENDVILYINDVPTSNLSLQAASELIDDSDNLCLIVSSKSSNDELQESEQEQHELRLDEDKSSSNCLNEMSRDNNNNANESSVVGTSSSASTSSISRNTANRIILANPAFTRFINYSNENSNSSSSNLATDATHHHHQQQHYSLGALGSSSCNFRDDLELILKPDKINPANSPTTTTITNTNNNNNAIFYNNDTNSSCNDAKKEDNDVFLHNRITTNNIDRKQLNYENKSQKLLHLFNNKRDHHHHQTANQTPARNNNYLPSNSNNLIRNYYSANESNGEEESEWSYSYPINNNQNRYNYNKFGNIGGKNNNNNKNNNNVATRSNGSSKRAVHCQQNGNGSEETSRVSYASITLRQPVKDVNYFSDTEAISKALPRYSKARNLSSSNYNKHSASIHYNPNHNHNNLKSSSINSTNYDSSNNLNRVLTLNSSNNSSLHSVQHNNHHNLFNNNIYNPSSHQHRRSNSQNYNHSILSNHNNIHYDHKLSDSDYIAKYNNNSSSYNNNNNNINNNHNNKNNIDNHRNYLDLFSNIFLKEQMNQNTNNTSNNNIDNFYNSSGNQNMFSLSTATDFNRKPHGFSKLGGNLNSSPSPQPNTTSSQFNTSPPSVNFNQQQFIQQPQSYQPPQQHQQHFAPNQLPRAYSNNNNLSANSNSQYSNVWSPSSSAIIPPRAPNAALDDDIDDPIVERYEREMGSELAKPSPNKPNYSDSYFYNSPVHNYPTIDDQKKLAKTIADTLEGSNPATSKYHKKKQTILKQMAAKDGYDSEPPQSPGVYSPDGSTFYPDHPQPDDDHFKFSIDDSTLPDIIKRSIAKANMTDPVRMVQAPENFRQQHYTEHVTHTEMPPKAAMSLAAALESDQGGKGGRGAQIFQRRKAKSEKWVIDESNVKRAPGQPYYQPPPTPPIQPKPIYIEPPRNNFENEQNKNLNFSDFNAKPKGWPYGAMQNEMPRPTRQNEDYPRPQPQPQPQPKQPSPERYIYNDAPQPNNVSTLSYNPNKLDLSNWNSQRQDQNQNQNAISISKDGIQNLKARYYESVKSSEIKGPQLSQVGLMPMMNDPRYSNISSSNNNNNGQPMISKVKLNKLSSHQNYLFNNKNAVNALKNTTNQYNNNNVNFNQNPSYHHNYDESIAASDL